MQTIAESDHHEVLSHPVPPTRPAKLLDFCPNDAMTDERLVPLRVCKNTSVPEIRLLKGRRRATSLVSNETANE